MKSKFGERDGAVRGVKIKNMIWLKSTAGHDVGSLNHHTVYLGVTRGQGPDPRK